MVTGVLPFEGQGSPIRPKPLTSSPIHPGASASGLPRPRGAPHAPPARPTRSFPGRVRSTTRSSRSCRTSSEKARSRRWPRRRRTDPPRTRKGRSRRERHRVRSRELARAAGGRDGENIKPMITNEVGTRWTDARRAEQSGRSRGRRRAAVKASQAREGRERAGDGGGDDPAPSIVRRRRSRSSSASTTSRPAAVSHGPGNDRRARSRPLERAHLDELARAPRCADGGGTRRPLVRSATRARRRWRIRSRSSRFEEAGRRGEVRGSGPWHVPDDAPEAARREERGARARPSSSRRRATLRAARRSAG